MKKPKVNFLNLTENHIDALTKIDLRAALRGRGIDVSNYSDKAALVRKALAM